MSRELLESVKAETLVGPPARNMGDAVVILMLSDYATLRDQV